MTMDDSDRATILRRRALLVGSTLAAIGSCARGAPPAESAKPSVVAVPNATDDAGASSVPEPDASDLPPRTAHDSDDDPPSIDIPDGVNQRVRTAYEHLASTLKTAYDSIHEIESTLPNCSVTSCQARWRPIADKIYDLENMFRFFYSCGAASPEAKAYVERERQVLDQYRARRQKMDERVKSAAAGEHDLEQLMMDVRNAHPVPCLSIACVPW